MRIDLRDAVMQTPKFFRPDEGDRLERAKRWLAVARGEAQGREKK